MSRGCAGQPSRCMATRNSAAQICPSPLRRDGRAARGKRQGRTADDPESAYYQDTVKEAVLRG